MIKRKLKFTIAVISALIMCFGLLVLSIVLSDSNRLESKNTTNKIEFIGTYSEDGGSLLLPLNDGIIIDVDSNKTVVFKGNFSRDVLPSEQIMFRSVNLIFSVTVNGEKVYSFGQPGGDMPLSKYSKSPGNCWAIWNCGVISMSDEIIITVNNVYTSIYKEQYSTFCTNIYAGSVGGLYKIMYDKNFFSYVFGAGLFFLGIALIIVSVALFCFERKITMRYLWLSFGALISGLWCYIDFDYISLVVPYPVFINMLDIVSLSFMLIFMLLYVKSFLTRKATRITIAANTFLINAFVAAGIVLQLCGVCDLQELLNLLTVLLISSSIIILFSAVYETVKLKSKDTFLLSFNLTPLVLCGLIQILSNIFSANQKSGFLRLGILLFCLFAIVILLYRVRQAIKKLKKSYQTEIDLSLKENELLQSNVMLMLSQIQPHFLFNTLTAVGQLCAANPLLAEKAIHNFADYLRGNIDAIGENSIIPFMREIAHVQVYLELEKMRFEERVKAEFDLQITDFFIPTLTLQTIVENAVKHGITKKKLGGTVHITTRDGQAGIIITVSDDGAGFNVNDKQTDENTHIGLKNVSMRLHSICGGTLSIKSEIGVGTEVTVIIPKK